MGILGKKDKNLGSKYIALSTRFAGSMLVSDKVGRAIGQEIREILDTGRDVVLDFNGVMVYQAPMDAMLRWSPEIAKERMSDGLPCGDLKLRNLSDGDRRRAWQALGPLNAAPPGNPQYRDISVRDDF